MLYSNASNVLDNVEGEAGALRSALAAQGLLADLYQFTMAQGYWLNAPRKRAIFNYFVRRAPFAGDYFVLAGIEPLLESIENLAFSDADVAYLASLGHFRPEFLAWLRQFRFKGEVCAVAEGRPAFAGEPVLRVEGTLLEAELVSGLILAHLNYQTLVATKAARIVDAAAGKPIVELGVRRAHGLAGSVYGARAAYIAGVDLTSNVLAGKLFGLPVAGTMAHSWVMSFASEAEAFAAYAEIYPQNCTLLIDTFGATHGLSAAIPVLKSLQRRGAQSLGVRTDSGDPSKIVPVLRERLDAQGLAAVRIVLSGDLDEHKVAELVSARLPVDVFGVGSRLVSAQDDPALSGVYKLAACGDESTLTPCMKHSDTREKSSLPGAVNVVRFSDRDGAFISDLVVRQSELEALGSEQALMSLAEQGRARTAASAEVLLRPVMKSGRRLQAGMSAADLRAGALAERSRLPSSLRSATSRRLEPALTFSVQLQQLMSRLRESARELERTRQEPVHV